LIQCALQRLGLTPKRCAVLVDAAEDRDDPFDLRILPARFPFGRHDRIPALIIFVNAEKTHRNLR
jgi:hypothetical protein